jgi:hypothetical protein
MTSGARPVTAWLSFSILLAAACASSDNPGGSATTNTGSPEPGSSGSTAASGSSNSGSGSSSGDVASSGGASGSSIPTSSGASTGTSTGTGNSGQGAASGMPEAGGAASGSPTGTGDAGTFTGTCTASKVVSGTTATGTGPHKVVVETNSDPGITQGTIFRPMDLGGTEKYPIFVWGEGGCQENGLVQADVMGEIASHGYFIIADGTPNGTSSRTLGSDPVAMGKPLLAYITWAIAENDKPCSAYYHSLDTTKVATNGFSCGGLMAEGTAGDPRITTWALNSSGLFSADQALYMSVHTPVLIVLGGSNDIAYKNGENDYTAISALGKPIMLFSKNGSNHGGDLSNGTGDFSKIDLAWLNWWLKGDLTATGKGVLVGSTCTYCTDTTGWEVKSMNIP